MLADSIQRNSIRVQFRSAGVIYAETGSPQFVNKKNNTANADCTSYFKAYLTGIGSHIQNVYPTSIPNIGVRLSVSGTPLPYQTTQSYKNPTWSETFSIKVELIKTGEITAGGVLSGAYAQYRANSGAGQLLVEYRFASPVVVQPRVPTCKVATPDVTVPMGTVTTAQFKGVGTTTFPRTFDIGLNCSGGSAGTSTNAYVTLTDATASTNTSTTLSLTKDSKASGVGIQILRGDTLLGYGPDSSAVGNINQWYMGNIAQGQASLRVPLTARYVQTQPTISPGSANARATFTLSYQ